MNNSQYEKKLRLIKVVFRDVLEISFIARCSFFQASLNPKTGTVLTSLDIETAMFNENADLLHLPPVTLHDDFMILEKFIRENSKKISLDVLFNEDPFASAYVQLFQLGILRDFKVEREKFYSAIFDHWVKQHRSEIQKVKFGAHVNLDLN